MSIKKTLDITDISSRCTSTDPAFKFNTYFFISKIDNKIGVGHTTSHTSDDTDDDKFSSICQSRMDVKFCGKTYCIEPTVTTDA